jgi:uncharacterized protein (TIGR04222 family)
MGFLIGFAGTAVVFLVLVLIHRFRLHGGPAGFDANRLHPEQVAYLHDGPSLAVYTSVGGLRAAGAVGAAPGGALAQTGPMPAGATPLDRAVYNAAGKRLRVAALVAGGPLPAGFDPHRVGAARRALLRKRAGEVARAWPMLAAGHGPAWADAFAAWAAGRPPLGSLRDGWDLARELARESARDSARDRAALAEPAARELAAREAAWRYDGRSAPRRRWLPAVRRAPGAVVVQFAGRVQVFAR